MNFEKPEYEITEYDQKKKNAESNENSKDEKDI